MLLLHLICMCVRFNPKINESLSQFFFLHVCRWSYARNFTEFTERMYNWDCWNLLSFYEMSNKCNPQASKNGHIGSLRFPNEKTHCAIRKSKTRPKKSSLFALYHHECWLRIHKKCVRPIGAKIDKEQQQRYQGTSDFYRDKAQA